VFAYHIYCGKQDAGGDPSDRLLCDLEDAGQAFLRQAQANLIGLSSFITEFGSVSSKQAGIDEIRFVTGRAEAQQTSWIYWQYKYFFDLTSTSNPPQA